MLFYYERMVIMKKSTIGIRVSADDKKVLKEKAAKAGLSLSQYLTVSGMDSKIIVYQGGKLLAKEVYNLNKTLEPLCDNPDLPVQELKNLLTDSMVKLDTIKEKDVNGNIKN